MEENKTYKPDYIEHQENNNCQQFFGPVSNCVFAMPESHVTMQPTPTNQVPTGPIDTSEIEALTKKSRGPRLQLLFRNEDGEKEETRTQQESDRLKKFLSKHNLGRKKLDSSTSSKLNKVVATFWQRWKEKGFVDPKFEGAAFYRFLTEDCGIECPVDEKAFIRAARSIIDSGERDPEIYDNVAICFENN